MTTNTLNDKIWKNCKKEPIQDYPDGTFILVYCAKTGVVYGMLRYQGGWINQGDEDTDWWNGPTKWCSSDVNEVSDAWCLMTDIAKQIEKEISE